MYKISLMVIAFLALTINGLAQSDVSKARWKSKEIIIDGNDKEWDKPLNFYDDKTGLLFAISNDKNNLYFAFTVNDEMKMRKIMNAGWSIELSSKEKNKKFNSTITFPGVKMGGIINRKPANNLERKVAGNPLIKDYQSGLSTLSINGFQSNQTELKLNDHKGIDIAIGADSALFIVYEIAIPLKELMVENFIQLDELITLNITVNALQRPSSGGGEGRGQSDRGDEMSGMGGGRQGGGMGGMGGGRSGGRMGGGRSGGGMSRGGGYSENGSGDRSSLFEKASFKQKFTLAKN